MNAAFLLWVITLPRFFNAVGQYRSDRPAWGRTPKKACCPLRRALARADAPARAGPPGFSPPCFLLLWHLYSGMYYLYYLFSTGSVF